jgi:hypothetical protein
VNTTWSTYTFSFTPTDDFDQLLILPYKEQRGSQTDVKFELHIDDINISTNQVPSPVRQSAVNFTIPSNVCENENVYLDGSGTVDNFGHYAYFTEISYKNQFGQHTGWENKWTWGSPACTPVLLNDNYSQSFTANPDGSPRTYYVKLAINSGTNNAWFELVKTFTVYAKPDFSFNLVPLSQAGTSVTRIVTGLLPNANYSFEWYNGTSATGNIIGTTDRINVGSFSSGNIARTVRVINSDNPSCFTDKTVYTSFAHFRMKNSANLGATLDLSTYPNPSKGKVSLKLNNFELENAKSIVSVFNREGELVLNQEFEGSETVLELEGNRPGMYYVKIIGKDYNYNSTIILE